MSKSKDSAEGSVLKYLTAQNRPYSVNDIVQNLHKEHGKTAVQKALDSLVEDGKVREKTYGKQKVYMVDQSGFSEATPEELKEMDVKVEELEKLCKQNQDELKEAQAQLKLVNSSMTTEDAKVLVAKLATEVEELTGKYKVLSESQGEAISKDERNKIRTDREKSIKQWRSRKRMCMSMVDAILDNCDMKKAALIEDLGIETDESVGVTMPT